MADQTPNHGYDKPEPDGSKDVWGELLNSTIDTLDDDVVIKSTRANQPDAGTKGRWSLVTDDTPSPSLEYDDGNQWVTILDGTEVYPDKGTAESIGSVWNFTNGLQTNGFDVLHAGYEGDYTGTLNFDNLLRVGTPKNLGNLQLNYSNAPEPHFVVRGEMATQIPDDQAAAGTAGYAAKHQFITESGERIATLAADKVHNHIGFYTKAEAFDGLDYQPEKRFNIQGGAAEVNMDFYTTNNFQVRGSSIFHRVFADDGNDTGYTLHEGGYFVGGLYWDASREKVRMVALGPSLTSEVDMLELDGVDGAVEFNQNDATQIATLDATTANIGTLGSDVTVPTGTKFTQGTEADTEHSIFVERVGLQSLTGLSTPSDTGVSIESDTQVVFLESDSDRVAAYLNTNGGILNVENDVQVDGDSAVTSGDGETNRQFYTGTSEPTGWSDGDVWFDTS